MRKGEGIYGHEIVGFRHGWRGVIERRDDGAHGPEHERARPPWWDDPRDVSHEPAEGRRRRRPDPCSTRFQRNHIDALIAIGGDDTLGVAAHLGGLGVSVVGVPKTIDNDLAATDFTFGFHTAVQIATDAIDRCRRPRRATTA